MCPQPLSQTQKIMVCPIERNPLATAQLKRILNSDTSLKVSWGRDVPKAQLFETNPLVFVVDWGTLRPHPHKYIRQLTLDYPYAKILIIEEFLSIEELLTFARMGIHGFLPYCELQSSLISSIRKIAGDHLCFTPEILEEYVRRSTKLPRQRRASRNGITAREESVLVLVGKKLTNKEIGSSLGIAESTVKFHLSNILKKLGVPTRHLLPEFVNFTRLDRDN